MQTCNTVMQPSLSHTQKYHSFNAHPLLLNRKREKTAGSLRLIFKWFRWIPAHALHTEEKLRISQRTWPADPVASTPLSIPQHPHTHPPTHPTTASLNPTLPSYTKPGLHPNTSAFMPYSFSITWTSQVSLSVSHSSDSRINVNPDKQRGFSSGW